MFGKSLIASLCLAILLIPGVAAQRYVSVAYAYARMTFPGAALTIANAINNNNVIVGSFFDSASSVHGFIYKNGKYTQIDYPGSTETEALGINDQGDIVGVYQVAGPLNFHGFLRHNGEFTTIDAPQAQFGTKVSGINSNMVMAGTFDDSQGFIFREGSFTVVNAPQLPGESRQTQLNGITNLNWISGQVFTGGIWRGFWLKDRDLDFLEPPGLIDSEVTAMNGHGDIVGCHDASSGFVSFAVEATERNEGQEMFPIQQKLASCASGINYARAIVGNYFQLNQPSAFLAVPELTLQVVGPANRSVVRNPVLLSASASGISQIKEIQVWSNFKQVAHFRGTSFNERVILPPGSKERIVVQAVDFSGKTAKAVFTLTVK